MQTKIILILLLFVNMVAFGQTDSELKEEMKEVRKEINRELRDAEYEISKKVFTKRRPGETYFSMYFDLGLNNYLEDGNFPDRFGAPYAVKPFGSWNVAIQGLNTTRIIGKTYLQWGGGLTWYNFKWEDASQRIERGDEGVIFTEFNEPVDHIKSKLTVAYLDVRLIPMIQFGENQRMRKYGKSKGFRIGAGPYAGYRLGSHSKAVYNDGNRQKPKNRDSFYLENFRYGVRLQAGFRSWDVFFNYDMNPLFAPGRGPGNADLNAFSFGITF